MPALDAAAMAGGSSIAASACLFEILDKDYVARSPPGAGLRRQPLEHPFPFPHLPAAAHRRSLHRPADATGSATSGPARLLILDEAHHAAPASGQRYAIDSQITRAIRDLSPRFEHRLFLSATPHNGHSNSFSALLEILDPQRFCRGVKPGKRMLEDVMVRRLKDDLREIVGRIPEARSCSGRPSTACPTTPPNCVLPPSWTSTAACANCDSAPNPAAPRRPPGC